MRINTADGEKYQDINISGNDTIYRDIIKYINIPNHPKYKEYYDDKFNPVEFFTIYVKTKIELDYYDKSEKFNYEDNINPGKELCISIIYTYCYLDYCNKLINIDNSLEFVDNQTEEICKNYINIEPFTIVFVKNKTPKLCKLAVDNNEHILKLLPIDIRSEELCNSAVQRNGIILEYVPPELKTTNMCNTAFFCNGNAIKYIPHNILTNEMAIIAVEKNAFLLQYIPDTMKTPEICKIAFDKNPYTIKFVPYNLRSAELCAKIIGCSELFKYIPEEIITYDMCMSAVQENGWSIYAIPDKFKTAELWTIAVNREGYVLKDIPENIKTPEICKLAVSNNGIALEYVPHAMKTSEICKLAVSNNAISAFFHVPQELKTEELYKIAIMEDITGMVLGLVPDNLITYEMCKLSVQYHGYDGLSCIPNHMLSVEIGDILENTESSGFKIGEIVNGKCVWSYGYKTEEKLELIKKLKQGNI
jgi:hypothetical protein